MKDKCLQDLHNLKNMVDSENLRQITKWGIQDRTPFEWLGFTTEELGELASAIGEWQFRGGRATDVVKEAIQVATLSLKIAEIFYAERENAQTDKRR